MKISKMLIEVENNKGQLEKNSVRIFLFGYIIHINVEGNKDDGQVCGGQQMWTKWKSLHWMKGSG